VKKADLDKRQGQKVEGAMRRQEIPDRYGQGSGSVFDKREQRKRDAAQGLVPFAVKLPQDLVAALQARAQARGVPLSELVAELLRKGLPPASV